jgi:hypothetical protein
MMVAVPAAAVIVVMLRTGRSGQQHYDSGRRQYRAKSAKSHP